MNSKKKIKEFVLLEKSTPRKKLERHRELVYIIIGRSHLLPGGGEGVIFRGVGFFFFGDVQGVGAGASYISLGFFVCVRGGGGGVRCVPLVFTLIQSQSLLL